MDTRGQSHHNEPSTTTAWEVVVDELELKSQTKTDFKIVIWKDSKPVQFKNPQSNSSVVANLKQIKPAKKKYETHRGQKLRSTTNELKNVWNHHHPPRP
jgi:hypothetical protein